MRRHLPGLLLSVMVASAARALHQVLPAAAAPVVGEVVLALLLGLVLGNLRPLPAAAGPGVRFAFARLLRLAIVLLGARLAFGQVLAMGGRALAMVVALMLLALAVAHGLGRLVGVPARLASLIGVGTAVCGNTAIAAVAPVIEARDEDVGYAVATNTLFGTLAVFAYPLLGHALGLGAAGFGTWAGLAVNDTSQVVATGFAYGEAAGEIATTVKLTRNALMGLVIVGMGLAWGRAAGHRGPGRPWTARLRQSVPGFVVGFLILAALNSLGLLDALSDRLGVDLARWILVAAKALILVALAGVGLGTRLAGLRRTGPAPLLVGLATAVTTAGAALLLIRLFGPVAG